MFKVHNYLEKCVFVYIPDFYIVWNILPYSKTSVPVQGWPILVANNIVFEKKTLANVNNLNIYTQK